MANVLYVVSRFFIGFFERTSGNNHSVFERVLIDGIINNPYLLFGTVFVIIGFSIGVLKRIIRS